MKQHKLFFITGNKGKLAEMQEILPFVEGKMIDLPEIQEIDLRQVVAAKLRAATVHCHGQVIVDDTALYLEVFAKQDGDEGLPGPLIKWFLSTITNEGLAKIAQRLDKTRARACSIIGYADEQGQHHFFVGSVLGTIVSPQGTTGFGWDHIFVPDGYQETFARMGMKKKNQISPRAIAAHQLKSFLIDNL